MAQLFVKVTTFGGRYPERTIEIPCGGGDKHIAVAVKALRHDAGGAPVPVDLTGLQLECRMLLRRKHRPISTRPCRLD